MTPIPQRSVHSATVAHHLRLAGIPATADRCVQTGAVLVCDDWSAGATAARVVMVLHPSDRTLERLAVRRGHQSTGARIVIGAIPSRTLHVVDTFEMDGPHQVVARTAEDRACWIAIRDGGVVLLLVGSDLAGDLLRYRQGDPARVSARTDGEMWGFPGERPVYLYEDQVPSHQPHERPVDAMVMALATWLASELERRVPSVLPDGAPGLVVVTGDDDQAFLDKYDEQLGELGAMPITYFLHPLSKHTRGTLDALARRHHVEFGLHPDALEHPARYEPLFAEQADWFERVTGAPARLVRNHGYLNDGYWGHLPSWRRHHIRGSANIPGVDGRVLNGSLWPARVACGDELTEHWSVLTAIGDGVRFALGLDGPASARCITAAADRIVASGVPGVLMLNLHPQNIAETMEMHAAVRRLKDTYGFAASTFGECLDWFAARDREFDAGRAA